MPRHELTRIISEGDLPDLKAAAASHRIRLKLQTVNQGETVNLIQWGVLENDLIEVPTVVGVGQIGIVLSGHPDKFGKFWDTLHAIQTERHGSSSAIGL